LNTLTHQRCFNHAGREAVARCPECGQCFCRECITEHDDRVVCAACLKKLTQHSFARHTAFAWLLRLAQCSVGILIVWFFFFFIGAQLLKLPDATHAGTLWQVQWIDEK
jgi:hypothetical protein